MKHIDYSGIPEHMREGVRGYVEEGCPPGGFLKKVLCNELIGAAENADDINNKYLYEWAKFVFCELPRSCWGDIFVVEGWIKQGGLHGYIDRELPETKCQMQKP